MIFALFANEGNFSARLGVSASPISTIKSAFDSAAAWLGFMV